MSFASTTGGHAAPPASNIAARLGAIILVVVGLLFVATSALGFLPSERRMTTAGLVFLFVLGLVLGGVGMMWLRSQRTREASQRQLYEERSVLAMLQESKGLTLPELSRGTDIPVERLESVMGRLTHQQLVEPDLTADGKVLYRPRT